MTHDSIPLSVPHLAGSEWDYVKECLDTNWVSSVGAFVNRFEMEVASTCGAAHGVATVNGTAALHTALMLAGVVEGDEVVVSDLTFIAPVNAIRYVGAFPVLVDAEPSYWQMDVEKLSVFLEGGCEHSKDGLTNKATGRPVKAILPVHILGSVCDVGAIVELGNRFGLPVIEDATECLGAVYRGRPVGSVGLMGCVSFNGNKIITTGGGGMLVTNREDLALRARYLTTQAKDDPVEFVHNEVGYNYRLTNVLAAIGCAQIEQLETFVARKREIAATYNHAFRELPGVTLMREPPNSTSTFWMYTIQMEGTQSSVDSRCLISELEANGIQARPLWQPMHRSPAHKDAFPTDDCKVAEKLNRQCVSLPCSVSLTQSAQARVVDVVTRRVLRAGGSG